MNGTAKESQIILDQYKERLQAIADDLDILILLKDLSVENLMGLGLSINKVEAEIQELRILDNCD